jgi:3-deoxy-D-manno-octulosonic-acid transferase
MLFCYKIFTYLFLPFSSIYLLIRKLKKKEHPTRYREKLSQIITPRDKGFLVWIHVASVGEAMSILPLVEKFQNDEKINKILITSVTVSSAQLLEKKNYLNKKVIHQFFPFDINYFIEKFLNHWLPDISIFVDSEIWPNLIFKIKERKIPLLLINARITKKTFLRWQLFKKFSQQIFGKFDLCIASNKETELRLKTLGAKNIKFHGNLKFTNTISDSKSEFQNSFLNKIKNRKVWCASSTHQSEEIFCAKTHKMLKKTYQDILTIIVPRHVERANVIISELSKLNLNVVNYSNYQKMNEKTDILLIDAYGETKKVYSISKCVFLGKSLIKSMEKDSGQNPIEASRFGCKIFHGPFISNFLEIYEYLKSLKVTKKINTYEELGESIMYEIKNKAENDTQTKEKLDSYGINILNNVIKEIKIYINN